MLFCITIYYNKNSGYLGNIYYKEIFVNPNKKLLVQEKKNSYIIGIGDNKNIFEEILYDIKKKDVKKEKPFEILRISEWPRVTCF